MVSVARRKSSCIPSMQRRDLVYSTIKRNSNKEGQLGGHLNNINKHRPSSSSNKAFFFWICLWILHTFSVEKKLAPASSYIMRIACTFRHISYSFVHDWHRFYFTDFFVRARPSHLMLAGRRWARWALCIFKQIFWFMFSTARMVLWQINLSIIYILIFIYTKKFLLALNLKLIVCFIHVFQEIAAILISFDKHSEWQSKEVRTR